MPKSRHLATLELTDINWHLWPKGKRRQVKSIAKWLSYFLINWSISVLHNILRFSTESIFGLFFFQIQEDNLLCDNEHQRDWNWANASRFVKEKCGFVWIIRRQWFWTVDIFRCVSKCLNKYEKNYDKIVKGSLFCLSFLIFWFTCRNLYFGSYFSKSKRTKYTGLLNLSGPGAPLQIRTMKYQNVYNGRLCAHFFKKKNYCRNFVTFFRKYLHKRYNFWRLIVSLFIPSSSFTIN